MRMWPLALGAAAGAAGWGIYNAISPDGTGIRQGVHRHPGEGQAHGAHVRRRAEHGLDAPALEVLDKHGVKATFFSIGHYAREQPSLLKRSPTRATRSATTPTRT